MRWELWKTYKEHAHNYAWPFVTMLNNITQSNTCSSLIQNDYRASGFLATVSGCSLSQTYSMLFLATCSPQAQLWTSPRACVTYNVCVFVRAVSKPVVGMLKGCVRHLEVDSGVELERWVKKSWWERWAGAGHYSNQMRMVTHSCRE